MLTPRSGTRIWLAAGVTDMRKSFDGLAARWAAASGCPSVTITSMRARRAAGVVIEHPFISKEAPRHKPEHRESTGPDLGLTRAAALRKDSR